MRTLWFILSTSSQSYLVTQGGTLIFSTYVGSGPSIYRSSKTNFRNFKHPKKIFEILATQKISQFCTLTLKKTLKCKEMTLKLAQFCDDPKIYPQNLHIPKNIHFFWKSQKILKFRILTPPKKIIAQAYVCVKISEYPPPVSSQSVMVIKFSDGHLQTL